MIDGIKFSIIVAVGKDGAIGKDGKMPWHLPEDLKYFREKTMGHVVIMGSNTFRSLGSKPLEGRTNVVVSKTMDEKRDDGVAVVRSPYDAIQFARDNEKNGETFIIGGAMLYESMFNTADVVYMTDIDMEVKGADRFFKLPERSRWVCVDKTETAVHKAEDGDIAYSFKTFRKKRDIELEKIYSEIGVDTSDFRFMGEGNIIVQLFGRLKDEKYEDEEYRYINFMPRRETISNVTVDLSSDEEKKKFAKMLRENSERFKIASYIMKKQAEELERDGVIHTSLYYYEMDGNIDD